jgi:hypothetical protein
MAYVLPPPASPADHPFSIARIEWPCQPAPKFDQFAHHLAQVKIRDPKLETITK